MTDQKIAELLNRFFLGNITIEEREELALWIDEYGFENDFVLLLEQSWQQFEPGQSLPISKVEQMLQEILQEGKARELASAKLVNFQHRKWRRVAAAAVIAGLIGAGVFLILNHVSQKDLVNGNKQIDKGKAIQDVAAPDKARAVITLANGAKVYIDSAGNGGALAAQGNVELVKLANGEIAYNQGGGTGRQDMQYNTLSNPRGSKVVTMTMSDGSKVWLNAGSSLTYPVAFMGVERKVEITGEAYFEVAHNATLPFKVKKGEMEVTVLGTHFNINAYEDEANIKVTLLEGSVKVSNNNSYGSLKPGQQAQVSSLVKVVNGVDVEEVMAWKNGRFQFEGAGIEDVMRQITRWYNVEVVYEGKLKEQHFRGGIFRNVEASKVLEMLEATGAVHFRIEGKRIIVMP